MKKDRVYAEKKAGVEPFEFNAMVAEVFDDMLNRSVPLYAESILRQSQMAARFFQKDTLIYDLGCSHGNLGVLALDQFGKKSFSMIGVDNSRPMIEKYKARLENRDGASQIHLICASLEDVRIKNASVVLINLTLQFLDPDQRSGLIQRIYNGLVPGGILLLTEKTIHSSEAWEALETEFYRAFKLENGYSELEISQKRDALEKVLIPDTLDVHRNRILSAGFSSVDVWLKWFNFSSMMAVKK